MGWGLAGTGNSSAVVAAAAVVAPGGGGGVKMEITKSGWFSLKSGEKQGKSVQIGEK